MSQPDLPASPPPLTPLLDPQDEQLDPLLRHVLAQRETRGISRVMAGLKVVPLSFQFLRRHQEIWPNVVWPALINIGLFLVMLTYVWTHKRAWMLAIWALPTEAIMQSIWFAAYVAFSAALTAGTYAMTVLLGAIVASPFNDIISERTEKILLGDRYQPPPKEEFWPMIMRSIVSSTVLVLCYGMCMIPVFALNLVPGLGSVVYMVAAAGVSSYFLSLEYSDILLQRKRFHLKEKFGISWQERTLTMGFGFGTSLTLAVPFVNFLCVPLAVIGGTATGLALEQWSRHNHTRALDDASAGAPTLPPPSAPPI